MIGGDEDRHAVVRALADRCRTRLAQLEAYADHVFRERQLLLRTDGRVHYLFLTPRLQKAAASVLACAALVALVMGGRLAYQSYLVHRGEAQIAALQAENVDLATALADAAELRKTEERIAASVRSLGNTLTADVERLSAALRNAGLRASDLLPRELAAVAEATVRPAARQNAASHYASDLRQLEKAIEAWTAFRTAIDAIPLARPTDEGRLTSGFGVRQHPVTGRRSLHRGIDISSRLRTPVFSPAPGVITFIGTKGGFGKFIEVDHGRGFKTRYGHLHKILVRRGQKVDFRQKLALVGSTGRSTGPHLHYEIMFRGKHLDPEGLFAAGHSILHK